MVAGIRRRRGSSVRWCRSLSDSGVVPFTFMPSKDAIHFTTNLRPEHHDRLLAEAERRHTTRNDVIRVLIESLPDPGYLSNE